MSHTAENGFLLHRDGTVFYHPSVLCRSLSARKVPRPHGRWGKGDGRSLPQHFPSM